MILCIDQGTTGSTVLLLDRRARPIADGYAEVPQHFPRPGWVEHDPEDLLQTTYAAIRAALQQAKRPAAAIEAIGITNQRETTLVWNRKTGKPISRAIVWQCRRTAEQCGRLKAAGLARRIQQKTGLVIDAYFSATKLQWLLHTITGARRLAERGELAFGTVDSWLVWNLTGGRAHVTDYTNASRTLLYNIKTLRWDPALLSLFEVPPALLPEVVAPDAFCGTTVASRVLPAGIPISGLVGDQQAAMVGHGCLQPGSAKNTYGTGCFLLLHVGAGFIRSRHGLLTTLVYGGRGPAYALEGSIFIAGAAVQWLRDGLQIIRAAAETEAIARSVKDTGGVYCVPAFVGLGAPYWDMDARGAIVGLTRGTTQAVIVRATLEALAYQTRDVVEAMQADSGVRLKELRVDGGAAQNDWLMQFQADILGIPVVRPPMINNTGKGAGMLAGIHAGWWQPGQFSALASGASRRFEPRMKRGERESKYSGWREAVARVRSHH
jgi:glycerol kinase